MDMSELVKCEQFSFQKMRKESSLQFTENFYVVQFDDRIALVPNNWLRMSDNQKQQVCFYPNYDAKKRLNKAIQSKEMPDLRNVKAGWAMYDILRILASADTFERSQEKLRMAENISDINTQDEENVKQTWHDRAAAKNVTSDDESSGTEVDSDLLLPLPDPKEFSGSQELFYSVRPALILTTYEHPIILPEKDKIKIVQTEKKKHTIIQQEMEVIAKHKKKELKDKNQSFINEDNVYSIDEYNKELTTHLNKNDEVQSQKVLKEILKKVNRILVEMTCIDRRLTRLENKADHITNKEININIVEEAFTFDTISSVDELQVFEQNFKSEEFFVKMNKLGRVDKMVKIALQITCRLDNIEELKPGGSGFRWYLKFTCSNCGESSEKWNYVSLDESTPVVRGNGVNHFVSKCKLCSRENSMAIIEDTIKSFTANDQGRFKTIVTFDCRGIEPSNFSARESWVAKATEEGKQFTEVDLSEGEWEDYCDKSMQPVGIYEIKHRFERVK